MNASSADYTGTENLEVMAAAVNYNRYLTDLIASRARPGDRILDIGAGIGTFAKRLSERGLRVDCVEPDARQAAEVERLGFVIHRDVAEVEDGAFDYIYSLNVLEHIEHDHEALRVWTTKLKPGGTMLIYVPAFQVLYSSMDRQVGHYRRYTRNELVEKMRASGLDVVRSEYADVAGFFATIAFKLVGNDAGVINQKALVTYDRLVFPLSRLLDRAFRHFLGKNTLAFATRPNAARA